MALSPHHKPLDLNDLSEGVQKLVGEHRKIVGCKQRLVLELGRYFMAPAGVFVASVRRVKHSRGKRFAVLDGGINCFFAAAGAVGWGGSAAKGAGWHQLENLDRPVGEQTSASVTTVVGPLCTPADTLAHDVKIGEPRAGDRIAFFNAGAYGPTASLSEFIGHPRAHEVLWEPETTETET